MKKAKRTKISFIVEISAIQDHLASVSLLKMARYMPRLLSFIWFTTVKKLTT